MRPALCIHRLFPFMEKCGRTYFHTDTLPQTPLVNFKIRFRLQSMLDHLNQQNQNYPKLNKSICCGPSDVGPWISDSTKEGPSKKMKQKLILFREGEGDFIERQWLLSAAQCVLISKPTMHSPFPTCAPRKPAPCSEFQTDHFQALRNISKIICFVRHRYQGSLRAWFKWSKTEHGGSIGKPDYVTHITWVQLENWKLYQRGAWSNEKGGGGCETSHLGRRPMGSLGGVAPHTYPPIAAQCNLLQLRC